MKKEAVIQLLLDTGKADIDSVDADGQTPLSYALKRNNTGVVGLLKRQRQ